MALSELETAIQIIGLQQKKYLAEQVEMKSQLKEIARQDPSKQQSSKEAIDIIDDNIQRMRMEGLS